MKRWWLALTVALLLAPALARASTAGFVGFDNFTGGSWKGVYGSDGYQVVNDSQNLPSYATVTPAAVSLYTWAASTSDPRGAQKAASPTDRIAACWFASTSFSLSVTISDGQTHQMAIYAVDWDNYHGRTETIEIRDAATDALLDSRNLAAFQGGIWAVWNISGNVKVVVINSNAPANAVVSGIFFGPVQAVAQSSSQATFIRSDTTTQGSWKGVYGSDGYNVINDAQSLPSYATLSPGSNLVYTWAGTTSDVRGLQKAASPTDRIAACWYSFSNYSVNVRISDGQVHSLALYAVDWDNYNGRTETIEIRDTGTNALLDSRSLAGFQGGTWLVWNIAGNVTIVVRNTNSNAVVSGFFFGAPQTPPNLIANGSFELGATAAGDYTYGPADQPPWSWGAGAGVTGGGSAFTSGNSNPTEGRLGAFLQNTGAISQTFSVTSAGNYAAYLRIVNRGNYGGQQSFAVDIDGATVLAVPVPRGPIPNTWMYVATPNFALGTGNHTIAIRGTVASPDSTAFIDEVRLTAATAFAATTIAGSFEEWQIGAQNYHYRAGAQPWAFAVGSGLTANASAFGSPNAPQGAQAAFVQDGGYMTQTWTDSGNTYQLQFSAAGRVGYGTPTLTASVDGVAIGSWPLTNNAYATFSAPVTIASGSHTVRFSSSGGDSFVDDVQLVATAATGAPGGFNVFESGTAAGSVAGVIHTKIAGTPFTLDVVVLDAARTAVLPSFTGSVKVELLDASNNSGALDAGGCRAGWTPLPGTSTTLVFAAGDAGRKSVTLSEANAWRDVRVRVSSPASGVATTVACSGDDFAHRPASFAAFAASDGDSAIAGTTRPLANASANGGNVHQAGRPFTVRANAVNGASAITTNYAGTATAQITRLRRQRLHRQRRRAVADGNGAGRGDRSQRQLRRSRQLRSATGRQQLRRRRRGRRLERGRTDDRLADDRRRPLRSRSLRSRPARRADPAHLRRRQLRGALVHLRRPAVRLRRGAAGQRPCAQRRRRNDHQLPRRALEARPDDAVVVGVGARLPRSTSRPRPCPSDQQQQRQRPGRGAGERQAAFHAPGERAGGAVRGPDRADVERRRRQRGSGDRQPARSPAAPLVFADMAFDAGSQFRYGVLRLVPAYGSELIDLPVLVEAQYWNGFVMATNNVDQCTAVAPQASPSATINATFRPARPRSRRRRRRSPAAARSCASPSPAAATPAASTSPCSSARPRPDRPAWRVGAAPTAAIAAGLPWLQGKWSGASAFDQNPATRASFGQYRSPFIYQRESY